MPQGKYSRRFILEQGALSVMAVALPLRGILQRSQPTGQLILYVGTYTSGKSKGIYLFRFDKDTGELKQFKAVHAINPSFVTVAQTAGHLYAVNEVSQFGGKSSGAVSAFAIDAKTGDLRFLNQQPSAGADPCHLIVDRTGQYVLVANYSGGNIAVLPIEKDGRLGPATDVAQHKGSSVNRERQEGPHAHCILLDRSNTHAFAVDLGLDKIMIYQFDASHGKLRSNKQPSVSVKPGAGPRHFTLHPSQKYAYVINELNSSVTAFAYNAAAVTLTEIQTVSTLPGDYSGPNSCAELVVSSSGKFLYGSNRGHDSIVSFAIDQRTGSLSYIEHVATQGRTPRNFTIDPTGAFLLVANQNSNTIVTFRIDRNTGKLKPTGQIAYVPSPVCLQFGAN